MHFAEDPASQVLIELQFKGTAAKPFRLKDVRLGLTIRELKILCQTECALPPEHQRLLYKGKLLQDTQRLRDANIPNQATIFLVKGAAVAKPEPKKEADARAREQALERERERDEWVVWVMACAECGVNPGRPQTDGLCGMCWREQVVKENKELKRRKEEARRQEAENARLEEERRREDEERERRRQHDVTRCYQCRKKIGLTGFQCQCSYYFCATHRYAEEHACTFDHKARGREILAQQNEAVSRSDMVDRTPN